MSKRMTHVRLALDGVEGAIEDLQKLANSLEVELEVLELRACGRTIGYAPVPIAGEAEIRA